jgi:hypothetical protein
MIDQLPEGKSIGWMQAPPEWIFTHTVRFVGIVRVVIQDGEGFILIRKGKPLVYYFKHGRIELVGSVALDYFNSHPIIEFNLCKYTPEEFYFALKVCNIEESRPKTDSGPERVPVRPDAEIPASREKDLGVSPPEEPGPELWETPEPVTEIPKPVAEIPEWVAEIPEEVAEIPEVVAEIPEEVAEIPEELAEIPEVVAQIRKQVAEIP